MKPSNQLDPNDFWQMIIIIIIINLSNENSRKIERHEIQIQISNVLCMYQLFEY